MPDIWSEVHKTASHIIAALDHKDEARKLMNLAQDLFDRGAEHQLDAVYADLLDHYRDVPLVWDMFSGHFSEKPGILRPGIAQKFFRSLPRNDDYLALAARIVNYHLDRSARPSTPEAMAHSSASITLNALKLLGQQELFERVCGIYSRIFGGSVQEVQDSLREEGTAQATVHMMPGQPVPRSGVRQGDNKSVLMRLKASNE